ncbi:hypothetical protein KFL_006430040 [Klebsormidium nitens]|uniref:Uncharacterized protein n=1 Tax=Klebsormidium nitens TaxID=105231 RepID=A0A1Y1IPC8_KLENI|nr:hypothetical protein KFL_006430040 [Klebsormidium nitens]|eukprot:GAQ90467.1 hypothetical protein KFL_006430040 [Klebsormidium nitens]
MALPLLPRATLLLVILSSTALCFHSADLGESWTDGTRDEDEGRWRSDDRTIRPALKGRRLAQDSWIDPFQERLPGQGDSNSLFRRWFGNKATSKVALAVEEGRKRLEVVSAAMAKRAKALGQDPLYSPEDKVVSKAAAQLAAKLATAGEEGASRGGRFADRELEGKGSGGKRLSPLDLAKQKIKKDKEDMYVEGVLEAGNNEGERDFIIVEDPAWEEGIVNEFVRQYVKELQGDYEGLDDTMHFQIDRVESQIREYARAQADAVWKAWEDVVDNEKRKVGLRDSTTSAGQLLDTQRSD